MGYHDQRPCSLSRSARPHSSKLATKHEVAGAFMDCSLCTGSSLIFPGLFTSFFLWGKKIPSNTFSSGTLTLSRVPWIRPVSTKITASFSCPFSFVMKNIYYVSVATAPFCSLGERGSQVSHLCKFSLICSLGKYTLSSCCGPGPAHCTQDVILKKEDEGIGLGNSQGSGGIRWLV